jgi:hypothetical protein
MIGDDSQDIRGTLNYRISAVWLNTSESGFPDNQFEKGTKNIQVYSIRFQNELYRFL